MRKSRVHKTRDHEQNVRDRKRRRPGFGDPLGTFTRLLEIFGGPPQGFMPQLGETVTIDCLTENERRELEDQRCLRMLTRGNPLLEEISKLVSAPGKPPQTVIVGPRATVVVVDEMPEGTPYPQDTQKVLPKLKGPGVISKDGWKPGVSVTTPLAEIKEAIRVCRGPRPNRLGGPLVD
jgi:hypothetical protein